MKLIVVITFLFIALVSMKTYAITQLNYSECPTEFEGVVTNVSDVENRNHTLSKVKITFKNERSVRKANFENKAVEILKYGMIQVKKGALYSVALRGQRVCDIREI